MNQSKIEKKLKEIGFEEKDLENSFYILGKTRENFGVSVSGLTESISFKQRRNMEDSGVNLVFLLELLQTQGILDYGKGIYRINSEYASPDRFF